MIETIGRVNEMVKAADADPLGWPQHMMRIPIHTLVTLTVFQYFEKLSDREMVDLMDRYPEIGKALEISMDRNRALSEVLCEFRRVMKHNNTACRRFIVDLNMAARIWDNLKINAECTLETREILQAVCFTTRVDTVFECILLALEAIAANEPEWITQIALPHWYCHYTRSMKNAMGKSSNIQGTIQTLGSDIEYLLQQIEIGGMTTIAALPEIQQLKEIWMENFTYFSIGNLKIGQYHWREDGCTYCSQKGGVG